MTPVIALLTDFGMVDTYVGVMKGVILSICPEAQVIDLTHQIQPQNVRQAAFMLMNSYRYFPSGTVFTCVVDPGVGSERLPLAAEAGGFRFVAPDNGLLSYVLSEYSESKCYALQNTAVRLQHISNTFHGRDIFAPASASLARGFPIDQVGAVVAQPHRLPSPHLVVERNRIAGEIIHIDHFGNAVTSIGMWRWASVDRLTLNPRTALSDPVHVARNQATVRVGMVELHRIERIYSDVERGALLAMIGSSGYLEIAMNQGDASKRLGLSIGDRVEVEVG